MFVRPRFIIGSDWLALFSCKTYQDEKDLRSMCRPISTVRYQIYLPTSTRLSYLSWYGILAFPLCLAIDLNKTQHNINLIDLAHFGDFTNGISVDFNVITIGGNCKFSPIVCCTTMKARQADLFTYRTVGSFLENSPLSISPLGWAQLLLLWNSFYTHRGVLLSHHRRIYDQNFEFTNLGL